MFEDHILSFVDGRLVSKSFVEAAFGNAFASWVKAFGLVVIQLSNL